MRRDWYEPGLGNSVCPACRYLLVLSLVLSLPGTLLCIAKVSLPLSELDGPALVDGAIRLFPHGLELEFNGKQLALRPEGSFRRRDAEAPSLCERQPKCHHKTAPG